MKPLALYPSLKDKRVLITGGASGIGSALVESFALQGARVAFIDLNHQAGRALEDQLSEVGPHAPKAYQCDLTDLTALTDVVEEIADELDGPADVLINNAANDDRHEIGSVTPEYWDQRIAVNLRHQFFCTQAVLPGMKARGEGSVINLGSVSWHLGLEEMPIYVTAKAGVTGMTRALARDLGPYGIRVNCIVPGAVRTERQMQMWQTPDSEQDIVDAQCLKGRIEPHHVAAMALFLAAEDSAMCTGHEYFVDAGWK